MTDNDARVQEGTRTPRLLRIGLKSRKPMNTVCRRKRPRTGFTGGRIEAMVTKLISSVYGDASDENLQKTDSNASTPGTDFSFRKAPSMTIGLWCFSAGVNPTMSRSE